MKYIALTLALMGTLAFSGLLMGCQEEGPAEQAGQDIDQAAEDARDAMQDAIPE